VILWDAETGRSLARGYHDHLVNQCDFDPRGEYLLTASSDYSARLWTLPDLRLAKVLVGHDDDVMKASFSPSGEFIATCSCDTTLAIFDRDGVMLHRLRGHNGVIEGFDWSRDGRELRSCGTDGTLRSWDAATGECIGVRTFDGVDVDVVVTTTGGAAYAGDNGGQITRIGPDGSTSSVQGHEAGVKRLILAPDESRLISLGYDNSVILWTLDDAGTPSLTRRSTYPDCVWARSAAFLDNQRSVHGTFGSKYAIWDWAADAWDLTDVEPPLGLNAVMEEDGHVYAIGDAGALIRDGRKVGGPGTLCNFLVSVGELMLTGGQKGIVYNARTGEALYNHGIPLNFGVAFARAGEAQVAIGSYSGHLLVFRVDGDRIVLVRSLAAHGNAIKGVSTDGVSLFSGSADGELVAHDIETLEPTRRIEGAHDGILNSTCAFAGGFATVSRDLTMRLWRGDEREVLHSRHPNSIKCMAADPAGGLIASGSYGGTIEIYDVAAGQWLEPLLRPTAAGISCIAWAPARGCFLAASYDGSLHAVQAAHGGGASAATLTFADPS